MVLELVVRTKLLIWNEQQTRDPIIGDQGLQECYDAANFPLDHDTLSTIAIAISYDYIPAHKANLMSIVNPMHIWSSAMFMF
jgi:hypothetical protein